MFATIARKIWAYSITIGSGFLFYRTLLKMNREDMLFGSVLAVIFFAFFLPLVIFGYRH